MLRLLENEFLEAYENLEGDDISREVSMATGRLAYSYLKFFAEKMEEKFKNFASQKTDCEKYNNRWKWLWRRGCGVREGES